MSHPEDIPFGLCQCGCGQSTPIARRTRGSRGVRKGKPLHFIRGHRARLQAARPLPYEIDEATGCWNWAGAMTTKGYGQVRRGGRNHQAHRWMYEQRHGPVPAGMQLDHLCRNRRCVNPDHLEAVTPATNQRRAKSTKLTEEAAAEIRRRLATEHPNLLAAEFGVHPTTIYQIRSGRTWRDHPPTCLTTPSLNISSSPVLKR